MDEVELTMSNGKPILILKGERYKGTVDEEPVLLGCGLFLPTPTSSCVTVKAVMDLLSKEGCIIIPQAAFYELQNRIICI